MGLPNASLNMGETQPRVSFDQKLASPCGKAWPSNTPTGGGEGRKKGSFMILICLAWFYLFDSEIVSGGNVVSQGFRRENGDGMRIGSNERMLDRVVDHLYQAFLRVPLCHSDLYQLA